MVDIFSRVLKTLLVFNDSTPEKLILTKDIKAMLWKLMLAKGGLSVHESSQIWLLASGAANSMSMRHYQNYYYILRDQNMEYPNPCFG